MEQQGWSVVLKTVLQPSQQDTNSWNIKRSISLTTEIYSLPAVRIQSCSLAKAMYLWVNSYWKRVLKIAEFLSLSMSNLVLAASNHCSFFSSTWAAWASAPQDLFLVTEVSVSLEWMKYPQDGNVGAHCGILLPLSRYRSSILEAPSFAGPIQVIKMEPCWGVSEIFSFFTIFSCPDRVLIGGIHSITRLHPLTHPPT